MKYIDYSILQRLLVHRGKMDFPALVYRELGLVYSSLSSVEQAHALEQIHSNGSLLEEIKEKEMQAIFEIETDMISILARMEEIGVRVDAKKLTSIGKEIVQKMTHIEAEIFSNVGEVFNLNSPKQIQYILFEKLGIKPLKKNKTGYSVDTEVLEEIAKSHDIARSILEYRLLAKLNSTYIIGLSKAIQKETSTIHTTYESLGTSTGRLSSNDPNLQNIPTGDGYAEEIKSCFIPRKGNILMVADYSQIELRILALLSQDPHLLEAFENGEDIHERTARFLFPNEKTISQDQRRIAKMVNFGVIYGITGFGLAKTLGCSPWEAGRYVDAFYEKYSRVGEYYDDLVKKGEEDSYVSTLFGRRRYISSLTDANKTLRAAARREAINMPVQGTAADILKFAMREIAKEIKQQNLKGSMILQVHDELVFDIPKNEQETFQEIVRDIMEHIFDTVKDKIQTQNLFLKGEKPQFPPILVDIGVGENWAKAK
ncbi:hypothetical protein CSB09_00125 [Candidatus Gracilibacteria bacterium]|nr:MAG: hypothetical protein CSB09_00125 [Candidatus Gracilibacteria bacterium]